MKKGTIAINKELEKGEVRSRPSETKLVEGITCKPCREKAGKVGSSNKL